VSKFNIFLNIPYLEIEAKGKYIKKIDNYIEVEFEILKIYKKEEINDNQLEKKIKIFIKEIIKEYIKDIDFYGNIKGDLMDFIVDYEKINNFLIDIENHLKD